MGRVVTADVLDRLDDAELAGEAGHRKACSALPCHAADVRRAALVERVDHLGERAVEALGIGRAEVRHIERHAGRRHVS